MASASDENMTYRRVKESQRGCSFRGTSAIASIYRHVMICTSVEGSAPGDEYHRASKHFNSEASSLHRVMARLYEDAHRAGDAAMADTHENQSMPA